MRNLHEAKNMALRVEFMIQDHGRFDSSRRNYGGDNPRAPVERGVTIRESQPHNDRFREEKAAGK